MNYGRRRQQLAFNNVGNFGERLGLKFQTSKLMFGTMHSAAVSQVSVLRL